jgi:hypothetical protein
MTNDQHWYNEMHRITDDYNDEDSTSSDLAEALSNFMDDEIYGQLEIRVPILIDLIETTIAKVNWEEIADALIEENKPELVYSDGYIKEFPPNKSNSQS